MARLNQDKDSLAKIMDVVSGAANAANAVKRLQESGLPKDVADKTSSALRNAGRSG